ncbi:hypothetical protein HGM15179_018218 [Zosterops borbonicus]|uniref:Uncharacterized protein n=1 Tax=Zosterops borbonicus TaxID=364589 RepID=A0A8K1LCG7_9PASS|nr:hypothetical protein HGM15179_018218 [Zosterops borbonicus]
MRMSWMRMRLDEAELEEDGLDKVGPDEDELDEDKMDEMDKAELGEDGLEKDGLDKGPEHWGHTTGGHGGGHVPVSLQALSTGDTRRVAAGGRGGGRVPVSLQALSTGDTQLVAMVVAMVVAVSPLLPAAWGHLALVSLPCHPEGGNATLTDPSQERELALETKASCWHEVFVGISITFSYLL